MGFAGIGEAKGGLGFYIYREKLRGERKKSEEREIILEVGDMPKRAYSSSKNIPLK